MPLMFHNGQLLFRNGQLALSEDCCCEVLRNCIDCRDAVQSVFVEVSGFTSGVFGTPPDNPVFVTYGNLNRTYSLRREPALGPGWFVQDVGTPGSRTSPGILILSIEDVPTNYWIRLWVWRAIVRIFCVGDELRAEGFFQTQCWDSNDSTANCPQGGCDQGQIPIPLATRPWEEACAGAEFCNPDPVRCYFCPFTTVLDPTAEHCVRACYTLSMEPAPTVTIVNAPPAQTTEVNATFGWTTTGVVDLMTVSIDGGPPREEGSPETFSNLPIGVHTFTVHVENQFGFDEKTHVWEILDAGQPGGCHTPTVSFTETPPNPSGTSVTFRWSTTGTVRQVAYRLDGADPVEVTGQTSLSLTLPLGSHTLLLMADSLQCGSDDVSYSWTVSAAPLPPTVTIIQHPDAVTTDTLATFSWSTTGEVTSTTCQLDGGSQNPCTSPATYTGLSVGQHTFTVRVSNAQGTASDSFSWEVVPTASTVCDKIVQAFRISGGVANVDAEVTFTQIGQSGCAGGGWDEATTTWLMPGTGAASGSCGTNLSVQRQIPADPCGSLQGVLTYFVCSNCTDISVTGPTVRVTAEHATSVTGAIDRIDFAATGAAAEALIDQLLNTGQCQVPFHAYNDAPGTPNFFPSASSTCTLRIFPS
jgi:hypothetical protein